MKRAVRNCSGHIGRPRARACTCTGGARSSDAAHAAIRINSKGCRHPLLIIAPWSSRLLEPNPLRSPQRAALLQHPPHPFTPGLQPCHPACISAANPATTSRDPTLSTPPTIYWHGLTGAAGRARAEVAAPAREALPATAAPWRPAATPAHPPGPAAAAAALAATAWPAQQAGPPAAAAMGRISLHGNALGRPCLLGRDWGAAKQRALQQSMRIVQPWGVPAPKNLPQHETRTCACLSYSSAHMKSQLGDADLQ
jgi:hypothetical protein